MDFSVREANAEFRAEIRSFLARHFRPEMVEEAHRTGTYHSWELHRAMAAQGWIAVTWPVEEGGGGRDASHHGVLYEELQRAGAPVDGWGTTMLVASTIRHLGTDDQRREVLPRVLAGEILICLGYSEPDAGSDVAAARTRAVRDGDDWVIDGAKMFTTLAHESAFVFLLTRTNQHVPKHRGLTMFLVPTDAEGIEIRPVHTLGGARTNATFYNHVRVPDSARVGEVDGGWAVMSVALTFERGGSYAGPALRMIDQLLGSPDDGGRSPARGTPPVRRVLARAAVNAEVGRLLNERNHWLAQQGTLPAVEGSMAKLFASEQFERFCADLFDALGSEALRSPGEKGAPGDGEIELNLRHSVVTTIYGGTSEVQRGIIAERGLGLPRGRRG